MAHPCGIEPWGNFLFKGGADIRNQGLGDLQHLSDALLLEIICQLPTKDLGRLALTSKSLYCFANHEDLWRQAVLQDYEGSWTWAGCWQATYLATAGLVPPSHYTAVEAQQEPLQADAGAGGAAPAAAAAARSSRRPAKRRKGAASAAAPEEAPEQAQAHSGKAKGNGAAKQSKAQAATGSTRKSRGKAAAAGGEDDADQEAGQDGCIVSGKEDRAVLLAPGPTGGVRYLRVRGFYSDLLYQPWHCASVDIPAEWLEVDNVDRRRGLSAAQFREQYELPGVPVVLQGELDGWAAMRTWSEEHLERAYGFNPAVVAHYPMRVAGFHAYARAQCDEMPLYLFDKHFVRSAPALAADYTPPAIFGEDLFALLSPEHRPDYRWLIAGPRRSGSTFHVDPNATSAWNAVVRGAKKWVLYPPGVVPPGVHPSPDGADVAAPVSIIEWFLNFYAATKETKVRPVECIVRAGEVLYVPRGWWHTALNLEDGVAVTQNFVSPAGLPGVLAFLRPGRADLVSGCGLGDRRLLYTRLVEALRRERPALLASWEASQAAAAARAEQAHRLAAMFKEEVPAKAADAASSKHDATGGSAAAAAPAGGGFRFGFGPSASGPTGPPGATTTKPSGTGFSFGFAL